MQLRDVLLFAILCCQYSLALYWEVGTKVYKEFDSGWQFGEIIKYDASSDTYEVQFEGDGGLQIYENNTTLATIVHLAESYTPFEQGQPVAQVSDSCIKLGEITSCEGFNCTIVWEDGEKEVITDMELLKDMVLAAGAYSDDMTQAPIVDDDEDNSANPVLIGAAVLGFVVVAFLVGRSRRAAQLKRIQQPTDLKEDKFQAGTLELPEVD